MQSQATHKDLTPSSKAIGLRESRCRFLNRAIDPKTQIADSLPLVCEPGMVYELRVLNTRSRTVSGYFTDLEKLAKEAERWNQDYNVYVTLNPVKSDLLARADNRVQERAWETSKDDDVPAYRWILIDFDPVRPTGVSATSDEHQAALDRGETCYRWLVNQGFSDDSLLMADSGNGCHVLVRADLPNGEDGESRSLVKEFLDLLDLQFSDEQVKVDKTTGNPARICKIYGSIARKGDSVPERPHRESKVLRASVDTKPVDISTLRSLVENNLPTKATTTLSSTKSFDLDAWVQKNLPDGVVRTGNWNKGGQRYILNPCPFNPDHTNESACIVRFPNNGGISAKCHHDSCTWNWDDLRTKFEPDHAPAAQDLREGQVVLSVPQTPARSKQSRPDLPLTDLGNAERLVKRYGMRIRYCYEFGCWLVYNDGYWMRSPGGEIQFLAHETIKAIHSEVATIDDDNKRRLTSAWAFRSEAAARANAMLDLARAQSGIPVKPGHLDQDPYLLNVKNGTIDLHTGELRAHNPHDLITKISPVAYQPDAQCPTWEQFVHTIMNGNQSMIDFLQRAVGYMLTGDTSEQCFFFLHGTGANGKSTFVETIGSVLGDYYLKTPIDTFLPKRPGTVPDAVATLRGARMVVGSEVQRDHELATGLIKDITGGDTVSARELYGKYFTFRPECKVILYGNHQPIIDQSDLGTWRRVNVVPFTVTIAEKDQDRHLQEKLLQEREGILAWAVRGCLKWQELGLGVPQEVTIATADYREDMDVLTEFFEDRCIMGTDCKVLSGELYRAYDGWCGDAHQKPMTERSFGRALDERGFAKYKGTGGKRYRIGIGLKSTE